ncbi:hypothetical protein [Arsukibacterium sp.]|uniref:hypothetical protein n=1 Tax=Arsukibacterium sp. TaxID=1977258 RepID=UPI00299E3545|nr:hypothetical protein [Arsukibacterium sp.]MDX1678647.1 hypothetical protein [Arsukibacterium sp.]
MRLVLTKLLLTGVMVSSPLMAADLPGQHTHCQLGDTVRIIKVVYPQGGLLPCEVHYTKNGTTSVLWQASNEAGYCEQRAADFIEKQRGWGFECVLMPSGSEPVADDAAGNAGL